MKLDPVELRGIGIQITKLDGEAARPVNEREAGQGLLSFGKKAVKNGVEATPTNATMQSEPALPKPAVPPHVDALVESRSRSGSPVGLVSPRVAEERPDQSHDRPLSRTASPVSAIPQRQLNAVAGPSRIPTSSDGIDPDFLAALPDDLRQEVKRDHAITRAQARARAESERPARLPSEAKDDNREDRATTISPLKTKGMHKTAHITKQLRPKVKTQLRASAISDLPLYGAWNRAQSDRGETPPGGGIVDVSASASAGMDDEEKIGNYFVRDLRELGIDPTFLKDLPEEMQKEVVDAEVTRRKQRQLLHRPADTSRVRALARARARESTSLSARSSRAGSAAALPPPPARMIGPTITRPSKPKLYNATTLPEITDILTKWIESRKGSGPAARDANKVQAYLIKCLAPDAGLGGTEMAIEVLRFMRVAIDSKWEEGACEDDMAGSEWWSTWAAFRAAVDALHRERFGAGLRL